MSVHSVVSRRARVRTPARGAAIVSRQ